MVHRPTNATILGALRRGRPRGGDQPIAPGLQSRTTAAGRRSLRVPRLPLPTRQARERSRTEAWSDDSHAKWLGLEDEQTHSAGRRDPQPAKGPLPTDPTDNWQVYLDHVSAGPIPNMCCRWHLNGKCRLSCFLRDSHVALTTEQVASIKEWIKQCQSRMRQPTHNKGTGNKKN